MTFYRARGPAGCELQVLRHPHEVTSALDAVETGRSSFRAAIFERNRRFDREILAIAGPALFTLAAAPLVGLVDVFIGGRLGTGAQAGLSLGVAMFGFLIFSTNFLEYGTTAIVAQRLGAGDGPGAKSAGRAALLVAVVFGLMLSLAVLVTAPWFAETIMRAEGDTASEAADYLRIRMLGAMPFLVLRTGNGWFRGRGNTRTPLVVSVAMAALSIALAPLFAFGLGEWQGWGLKGIAFATAGAETLGAVVMLALLRVDVRRVSLIAVAREKRGSWGAVFALNRDILLRTLCVTGTFTLASIVASAVDKSGATAAGHGVISSVWLFTALALDSLAIAAQTMAGQRLGGEQIGEARRIAARISTLEFVAGAALGVLLALASPFLAQLFSDDPAVQDAILPALIVLAILMPLSALAFGLDGVFLGAGDGAYLRNSMAIAAIPTWVGLGLVALLSGNLLVIWLVLAGFLLLRVLTLTWRLTGSGWTTHRL